MFIDSRSGKVAFIHNKVSDDAVVILGHGYLSDKNSRTNTKLVEMLNSARISTIAYDMYGHGESEGDIERLTVSKVVDNVLALYDYAKSQGYSKIGLSGSSFTGIVSLIAATKRDFSVLSLKCPVFDSKRLWDERYGKEGVEKWKKDGYVKPFSRKWYFDAYEDACKYDMKKIVPMIRTPTIVIHGTMDVTVSPKHAEDIIANLAGEKKLVMVEGADHFFRNQEHFNTMVDASFRWLKNIKEGFHINRYAFSPTITYILVYYTKLFH